MSLRNLDYDMLIDMSITQFFSTSYQVEGDEDEEADNEPEGTEPDFALVFYNLAVSRVKLLMSSSLFPCSKFPSF